MKLLITNNVGILLLLCFSLGLIVPGLDAIHPATINIFLALVIFFTCPQIMWSDLTRSDFIAPTIFYIVRFLIFPICLFWVLSMVLPSEFAIATLLLALSPAGVSAFPLGVLLGGNSGISLILVVSSFALCPFLIPIVLSLLGFSEIQSDPVNMGILLLLIIFLPTALYFSFVKPYCPNLSHWMKLQGSFWSALCIGAMVMLIVSQRKDHFFIDFSLLGISVVLLGGLYGIFYLVGWLFAWNMSDDYKISYAVTSGANSNSVGLAIGFLYFAPSVGVIMAVGEISWVVLVFLFEKFVQTRKKMNYS